MNLYQYLCAIEANKEINLPRFVSLLPAQYKTNWRDIFQKCNALGKDKYILTVKDPDIFAQLLEQNIPSENRESAAIKGNSHQHKTSMSYLLVFADAFNPVNLSNKVNFTCPNVVVCQQEAKLNSSVIIQQFTPKKTLIIIENQENFFRYQAFLPLLLSEITTGNNASVDVAFGSGNSVTNNLNSIYFDQYDEVYCCFDYDLGGLTMFASLIKLTTAKLTFVLPTKAQLNNDVFLNTYFQKKPKCKENWNQAIQLAERLGLDDLAQAFVYTKKFMEQEVYLLVASS